MPVSEKARIPCYSIALASAVALAYEILLVRLFSISQWYHYAYMIISLALLGYGASGAFLTLLRERLQRRFTLVYLSNLVLFAVFILISYALAAQTQFNAEEILWDTGQWIRLSGIYLCLSLPFFFVANAIGLALMQHPPNTSRVYAADLLGAGTGSLGVILLLFLLFPDTLLILLSILGLCAVCVGALELGTRRAGIWFIAPAVGLMLFVFPPTWLQPGMSPFKSLSQTLQISGTGIIEQRSSPLGLVTVVESPLIPLRHAPGLSLKASSGPPAQLGIFIDGDGPTAVTRVEADDRQLAYLDQLSWALPYHLKEPGRVLVLGAGGGSEVLQARYLGARHIDAVELNPQLIDLVKNSYGDFSGELFTADNVRIIRAEARGFISVTPQRYDLIQVALVDSFAASAAGLYALSESYLYTVQAFQEYIQKLAPGGYLAISRWIKLPARDTLKLFATAVTALEGLGVENPGNRLALIRSWQTSTLVVKNGSFTQSETRALRRFSEQRGFDLSYFPGVSEKEVNRYNVMDQPYLYLAAKALLGPGREGFIAGYKFNLQPATDDRPYFFRFFTWRALPEILSLFGQGGAPLLDTGYLILAATLVQALLASLVLIVLPLWVYRLRTTNSGSNPQRWRVFIYFAALGLAFLFLEIAFIQKFILFLHHPLYSVAVVLTTFLLFAGAGSLYSQRLVQRNLTVTLPVIAIATVSLVYLVLLNHLFKLLMPLPDSLRILVSLVLIAPLAFCMGIPFPLGLSRVGQAAPQLMPWAWGINGCASVISAVLATLLAMHFGFNAVVLSAVALYGIAAASLPHSATRFESGQ